MLSSLQMSSLSSVSAHYQHDDQEQLPVLVKMAELLQKWLQPAVAGIVVILGFKKTCCM